MDGFISSSTAQFESTVGFSLADLVDWVVDIIVSILGLGLGLVNALLPIILAIMAISVIIGVVYHGLKWLHILH